MPLLSIVVPTRNRSEFLQNLVSYVLASSEESFELIICDASDTHNAVVSALKAFRNDTRLTVIDNSSETTGTASSMRSNWGKALEACNGEWVSVIGDDDLIDPQVVNFIRRVATAAPSLNAVKWNVARCDVGISHPREAKIPLGTKLMIAASMDSLAKQAMWPNEKKPPSSLCSPYHGAVKRSLLQTLRKHRGKWFQFVTPDYDLGWSLCYFVDKFVICERPFSVAGTSPNSNSFAVRNASARAKALQNWMDESQTLDGWGNTSDPLMFTLPCVVLGFRNAYCLSKNLNIDLNLNNFIHTLKISILSQEDEMSFVSHKLSASDFLKKNFGVDHGLDSLMYSPQPREPRAGLRGETLHVPQAVFEHDIKRFGDLAFGLTMPVNQLIQTS
jgi:glycosyltransferase involved in cell wall biosynthesis